MDEGGVNGDVVNALAADPDVGLKLAHRGEVVVAGSGTHQGDTLGISLKTCRDEAVINDGFIACEYSQSACPYPTPSGAPRASDSAVAANSALERT
jgi:hypothetical protein